MPPSFSIVISPEQALTVHVDRGRYVLCRRGVPVGWGRVGAG
jgi:hypothetical protein